MGQPSTPHQSHPVIAIASRYPYSLLTLWTALVLLGIMSVELGGIKWYDDSMRLIYSHVGTPRPLDTSSRATSSDIEDEPYARNFIQARWTPLHLAPLCSCKEICVRIGLRKCQPNLPTLPRLFVKMIYCVPYCHSWYQRSFLYVP